jgi:curved DNA-binding protein CbpA
MTASSSENHTDDLLELMSPDGYYTFLGVEKATVVSTSNEGGVSSRVSEVDEEAVKKAYRKLSRKHHPDKGGDAETFKGLARAYRVLGNSKLREQYDILGIDLDDDLTTNEAGKGSLDGDDMGEDSPQSTAQGIVQEIASLTLSAIIQLTVRTGRFLLSSLARILRAIRRP